MKEVFIPIKGFEKLYEVSNLGSIKSLSKKGSKKIFLIKSRHIDVSTGYMSVILHKNNRYYNTRIHRLLAEHFILNPNCKPIVNHIDGNKRNNRISNLEWCTYSENTNHSYKLGLQKPILGNDNHATKIKDNQIKEIFQMFIAGAMNKEISEKYNVSSSYISRLRNGKQRKNLYDQDYSISKVGSLGMPREKVEKIFSMLLEGISQKKIGTILEIDNTIICEINKGRLYKYITRPPGIPIKYKKIGKQRIAITNNDIC